MKHDDIRRLFPNASASLFAANAENPGTAPELERTAGDAALGKSKAKARNPERFLVRVTSVRKRLLDTDNLCEKYHVDCCRYAGLIPGDSPDQIEIETRQRKAAKGEEEAVTVEIYSIASDL
jgi:hypothetical protein